MLGLFLRHFIIGNVIGIELHFRQKLCCDVFLLYLGEENQHEQYHTEACDDEAFDIILGKKLEGYLVLALFERNGDKAIEDFFVLDLLAVYGYRPALLIRNGREQILSVIIGLCCAFKVGLIELCDLHNVLLELFAVCRKGLVIE